MDLSAWYHDWGLPALPARRCYVTPALDGWTLIFGGFPGVEKAIPVCEAVSRRLGECHWYASGWLVARAGRVVRYCDPEAYPGEVAELGDPLPFEDEYGDPGLHKVLAAISVDPERLGPHTRVEGRGVLALTAAGRALGPGAGALSI
ncbi:hypothetical protein [Dactylosporangium darangshiense]|uniref:Uncharacterized protein n=1 Tax=Dactylosporangium darangshiense TaxID=579108 RepID=A0ABP8DV73_9ACTN